VAKSDLTVPFSHTVHTFWPQVSGRAIFFGNIDEAEALACRAERRKTAIFFSRSGSVVISLRHHFRFLWQFRGAEFAFQ